MLRRAPFPRPRLPAVVMTYVTSMISGVAASKRQADHFLAKNVRRTTTQRGTVENIWSSRSQTHTRECNMSQKRWHGREVSILVSTTGGH